MNPQTLIKELWPTRVIAQEYNTPEYDLALRDFILKLYEDNKIKNPSVNSEQEKRIYDFLKLENPLIQELEKRFLFGVKTYLGLQAERWSPKIVLNARALITKPGTYILTHVERHEGQISMNYFLYGRTNYGKPLNSLVPRAFWTEDPSRYLNDFRFPHEMDQAIPFAPRPGLLIVMPGHLPHRQDINNDTNLKVQIVCTATLEFNRDYYEWRW
jgi:hypothetical protein